MKFYSFLLFLVASFAATTQAQDQEPQEMTTTTTTTPQELYTAEIVCCRGWALKRAPALKEFLMNHVELYSGVDLEMKRGGKTCELTVFDEQDNELGYLDLYDYASSVEDLHDVMERVGLRRKTQVELDEMYAQQAEKEKEFQQRREQQKAEAKRRADEKKRRKAQAEQEAAAKEEQGETANKVEEENQPASEEESVHTEL